MRPLPCLVSVAALGTVAAFTLAGCSEPAASDTATPGAPSSGDPNRTITVYTSEPQAKIDELVAEFEAETGIGVEVFRAGTGDLTARIEAERTTGEIGADVLLAADAPTFENYKLDGLLRQYTPADADAMNPGVVDPEGYYVGTRVIPTVIAYNTTAIDSPPTSWKDLTDPSYLGRITLPNPNVSGAAAFTTAVWLDTPGLGEEWLAELAANEPTVAESNGPVGQAVAAGTQPVGIVVDYLVRELAAKGSPIALSYPTDGVPYITQPAGIFDDSDNVEAAQEFVDFLVSRRGQEIAVSQQYLPVRADVGTPEGAPALSELTLLTPDLRTITDLQDEAVRKFDDLLG
ncbi:ABC transporter substrate-binding protein [Rhodococcus sp. CH91]|uniref:ABC transporter substrate-binding protein n=1 Tax=Rhodococcus sp. CH91 TaxID=2910256 RepID=UPI001F4B91F9|nr:ABC transporter substrate-binding protein [Rhodococcus sp. CH91]